MIEDERITAALGTGHSWNEVAPCLNTAIIKELESGQGLHLPRTEGFEDQQLSDEVRAVLASEIGDLVSSHGGKIELVAVKEPT